MILCKCEPKEKSSQKEKWPIWFSDNVSVGHYVRSSAGRELKVTKITHIDPPRNQSGPRYNIILKLGT